MDEVKAVYNSKTVCPVCVSKIEFTKVRSKAVRLIKQDTDFCPYYEGETLYFMKRLYVLNADTELM